FARAAEVDEQAETDADERVLELDGVVFEDLDEDFEELDEDLDMSPEEAEQGAHDLEGSSEVDVEGAAAAAREPAPAATFEPGAQTRGEPEQAASREREAAGEQPSPDRSDGYVDESAQPASPQVRGGAAPPFSAADDDLRLFD
ncbi:MAG: hypothetical protein JWO22_4176, partial [Frankiales bacterium]|nr:hypothetical protein [Frankiales bacterium]